MESSFSVRSGKVPIVTLLLITAFIVLITLLITSSNSEGEVGGPIAGMTSPTGWVVADGDDAEYSDETILLNGDLIVQSGGILTFDNVEMFSNARGDKNATIRILVEEGGTFTVRDSLLSSRYEVDQYQGNQLWRYKFHVYGMLNMAGTTVEYMWGNLEGFIIPDSGIPGSLHQTNEGGIETWSDDVFITDCVIARGQTCGMNIREGSPTIRDTDFIENEQIGMSVLDGESAATITGCSFNDNVLRGVTLHANYLEFRDNEIHNNGGSGFFIINSQNVSFDGLDISGNGRGLHVVLCDATFTNSTIVNNQVTMAVTNEGSVVLLNSECDITGDDLDLHDGCWVADCVPVEVMVRGGGNPLAGAKVRLEGRSGNLTWTGYLQTDSDGIVILPAALMVRSGEWWYNLSDFEVEVTYNGMRSNRTVSIGGPETITFDLAVTNDGGNGDGGDGDDDTGNGEPSDVKDEGDDENDLNDYLPIIGVVAVIAILAVVLVSRWKRNREQTEDDEWDDGGSEDDEWDDDGDRDDADRER